MERGWVIRGYEREAERLCGDLARLNHGYWSGLGPRGSAVAIYRRHRRLLSPRAVRRLRELAREDRGDSSRRARSLLGFALESRVNGARLRADAAVARVRATAVARAGVSSVPLGQVAAALAAEPDPERRRRLWEARDRVVEERLTPALLTARRRQAEALAELGYPSARSAFEESTGVELTRLADVCRRLLDAGREPFEYARSELEAVAPRPIVLRHASDLAPALSAVWDAGSGSVSPGLDRIYAGTLAGLGLKPRSGGCVTLDLAARPAKAERAYCAALRVPGEIAVVLKPAGRWSDVVALMHETGHALHRSHTDPDLDAPARLLGDSSVTESWAFLLEGLCGEPRWLRGQTGVEDLEPLLAAHRLREAALVRRHCARLLFELELESAGAAPHPERMRERYRVLQTEALGVECSGAGWLADLDPWFYSARYIRGWMLAATWRQELRSRFGAGWFEQPAAGRWLSEIWAKGQRLDAAELAGQTLGVGLGPAALEAELAGRASPAVAAPVC